MHNIRALVGSLSRNSFHKNVPLMQQYRSQYHASLQNDSNNYSEKIKSNFITEIEYAQPAPQIPTFRVMNTDGEILNPKHESMITVDLAKRFHKGKRFFK